MPLPHADLLQLKRWHNPTIYNGWEQITAHDVTAAGINLDETCDFMPWMGPMVGHAVTLVIEPSSIAHAGRAGAWDDWRRHVAGVEGPKIVVVQDLDKPRVVGSFWGVPVTVFGQMIQPGRLIHADKHGFLAIPPEDEPRLLEAATFMDANECRTVIPAAREAARIRSPSAPPGISNTAYESAKAPSTHPHCYGESPRSRCIVVPATEIQTRST